MNFLVEVSFFSVSPMTAANLEDRPLPEKNKSIFDPKGMSETHLPKLQQQEGTMLYRVLSGYRSEALRYLLVINYNPTPKNLVVDIASTYVCETLRVEHDLSSDQNPGYLLSIGDCILPNYMPGLFHKPMKFQDPVFYQARFNASCHPRRFCWNFASICLKKRPFLRRPIFQLPYKWLFLVPLKGGNRGIFDPPIGSIYHLYTTYCPCLLGGYMLPIPPFRGTRNNH